MQERTLLGILVGGGPAPGLNDVIAAATIYANSLGWAVVGFNYGYRNLCDNDVEVARKSSVVLTEDYVQQYDVESGSILIPDRFNPATNPKLCHNILSNLSALAVRHLLVIGGNDKMKSTFRVFTGVDPQELSIIAIPKTIDNDIQLPQGQTTFGFHSARTFGSKLVRNLIEDARSAPRWFIVETMGKYTGHLALSIANATSAHIAVIPEDFGSNNSVTLKDICDVIEGAIFKRLCFGKNYGVCVISEGLINKMNKNSQNKLFKEGFAAVDEHGQIILDDAELSRAVADELLKRMRAKKLLVNVTAKKIGYELRSTKPSAFDEVYCRELGFGAVEGFRTSHSNCMCVWKNGIISYTPFNEMMNEDGVILPRFVDTNSEEYCISKDYSWQLRPSDVTQKQLINSIASAANLSPENFIIQYGHVPSLTIA